MAQACDGCGMSVYRRIFVHRVQKFLGEGSGSCHCYEQEMGILRRLADTTTSAYDITFDHVREFGQKLHVHNLRELSAAEKRLGFQSVVMNSDHQNFDDPPQQSVIDMARVHKFKFSNQERYRSKYGRA